MKIKYESVTGEVTEVEVDDSIGAVIIDSRREEASGDRKERRHCWSLDAIIYEGKEYGTEDFTKALFDNDNERKQRVRDAFAKLTPVQQHRMILLAKGKSIREIARDEGKDYKSVRESIEAARKKFLKNF